MKKIIIFLLLIIHVHSSYSMEDIFPSISAEAEKSLSEDYQKQLTGDKNIITVANNVPNEAMSKLSENHLDEASAEDMIAQLESLRSFAFFEETKKYIEDIIKSIRRDLSF